MDRVRVGFFDSGIGGISVMTCAQEKFPSAEYLYYADTDHVPYGLKTREEIISYSDQAVNFLREHGADVIIIACNTATSMAADILREKYDFPIIGMEPAVKPAAQIHPHSKILVTATPVTIAGEKLHTLIGHHFSEKENHPDLLALPELVMYAEQGIFDTDQITAYLAKKIENPSQYDAVVLGCTHFTYFRDSFRRFFRSSVDLIDGNNGTVNRMISILHDMGYSHNTGIPCETFYCSGRTVKDREQIAFYMRLKERAQNRF